MLGKGHCKIDISNEDSEFRDFYDFVSASGDSDGGDDDSDDPTGYASESSQTGARQPPVTFVRPDEKTIRLSSGRILSHRSADSYAKARPRRRRFPGPDARAPLADAGPNDKATVEDGVPGSVPTSKHDLSNVKSPHAGALARSAKREAVFEKQLANLRAEDRRSLAHLTTSEQRVVLAKAKAQVERARKEENEMKLKIQLKANRSIKK